MAKDTNLGKSLYRQNRKKHRRNKPVELGENVTAKNDIPDTNTPNINIISSLVDHTSVVDELIFKKNIDKDLSFSINEPIFIKDSDKELEFIFKRPKWNTSQTSDQVDKIEKKSFNDYKRVIYKYQESNKLSMAPFEKNIEIWRQLWRVIEKSQIIFQIVDARNPLFFYSPELVNYINEMDPSKKSILLINKSDLLTTAQLISWKTYFVSKNIDFIFYSALLDSKALKVEYSINEELSEQEIEDDASSDTTSQISNEMNKVSLEEELKFAHSSSKEIHDIELNVLLTDRTKLISMLHEYKGLFNTQEKITVGFIGFPNVGKSSTINNIIGYKRTAVSFTPGKTRHLQTLHLDDKIILCDCPGLVFPKFLSNKSELLLNGILHIDHVKDFSDAIDLVVTQIPRVAFKQYYQIDFPMLSSNSTSSIDYCSSEELLLCISAHKNYIGSKNVPIFSCAAKLVLKDIVSGSFVHCTPPPHVDRYVFNDYNTMTNVKPKENAQYNKLVQLLSNARTDEQIVESIDKNFFILNPTNIHYKNQIGPINMTQSNNEFPSNIHQLRKGRKKPKKEKLRRMFKEEI